jgi:hypothetical protein
MSKRGKDDGWSLPHPPGGKKKKNYGNLLSHTTKRGEEGKEGNSA